MQAWEAVKGEAEGVGASEERVKAEVPAQQQ
jgi:hypothetical protein